MAISLDFTIKRPDAVRSLTLVGSVAGSDNAEAWKAAAEIFASRMENHGSEGLVSGIASAPQRQAFRERDEGGWERFVESMERLSAPGCARAMRGALSRPSVLELGGALASLDVPILLILGDQDLPSFGGSLFVLRTASRAALAVMPACGHTENLEDPDLFNRLLSEFLIGVDCARAASR